MTDAMPDGVFSVTCDNTRTDFVSQRRTRVPFWWPLFWPPKFVPWTESQLDLIRALDELHNGSLVNVVHDGRVLTVEAYDVDKAAGTFKVRPRRDDD